MIKYRLLLPLFVAMAVACSKGYTTDHNYTPSTTPIAFQTEDDRGDDDKTKAAEVKSDFVENDIFGVIGYYLKARGSSAPTVLGGGATPNFMYDQKVICGGANWSYAPMKYWPNDSNDRLQFFAYYPQNDGIKLSDSYASGYPTIRFEPDAKPYKQVDFMTATSAVVGKESQRVAFSFEHQLSQVSFQARHNDDTNSCEVVMTGITLTGPKIYKGRFTADGFEWETTGGVETHSYEATDTFKEIDGTELKYGDYTTVTDEARNGIMLLTPQKLLADEIKIYATFKVVLPQKQSAIPIVVTQEVVVPADHDYFKGQKTNYKFTLNVKELAVAKFDSITITDWVDGGILNSGGETIL